MQKKHGKQTDIIFIYSTHTDIYIYKYIPGPMKSHVYKDKCCNVNSPIRCVPMPNMPCRCHPWASRECSSNILTTKKGDIKWWMMPNLAKTLMVYRCFIWFYRLCFMTLHVCLVMSFPPSRQWGDQWKCLVNIPPLLRREKEEPNHRLVAKAESNMSLVFR